MSKRPLGAQVLWKCPKCRRLMSSSGPHAPHWVIRDGKSELVDCAGDLVQVLQ